MDHRFGDGDGWCSAAIHSYVHKDKPNTSMGWYHTKNPDGHGLREEDVKWGWTEIADLATARKNLSGTGSGVAALAIGGENPGGNLANTEEWTVPFVTKTIGTD